MTEFNHTPAKLFFFNPRTPLCIRLTGVTLTASSVQASLRHTEGLT